MWVLWHKFWSGDCHPLRNEPQLTEARGTSSGVEIRESNHAHTSDTGTRKAKLCSIEKYHWDWGEGTQNMRKC